MKSIKTKMIAALLTLIMAFSLVPNMDVKAADASIKVYVTISVAGNVKLAQKEVTVKDYNGNGTYDIDDTLYYAHEENYEGGAAAGYNSYSGDYGLSLGKLWGDESGAFGYWYDNTSAWSLADEVKDGSYVTAFVYSDQNYWSDKYSYFNDNETTAYVGKSVSVQLNAAGYDSNWNTVLAPYAGATINVLNEDGTLASCNVTTDSEGKATLTFKKYGTYYITATSGTDTLVPAVEKIRIKKYSQSVKITSSTKTVKYSKTRKSSVKTSKVAVKGAKTKVTYSKSSGSKKLSINKTSGKITVKKGTKRGTYKIKVKAYATYTSKYYHKTVYKTIKVKVK